MKLRIFLSSKGQAVEVLWRLHIEGQDLNDRRSGLRLSRLPKLCSLSSRFASVDQREVVSQPSWFARWGRSPVISFAAVIDDFTGRKCWVARLFLLFRSGPMLTMGAKCRSDDSATRAIVRRGDGPPQRCVRHDVTRLIAAQPRQMSCCPNRIPLFAADFRM